MAERAAEHLGPVLEPRAAQLLEEQPAPEQPDQAVGVPQRKGDGQAHVAHGEDGERVGHRPQHSGQQRPHIRCGLSRRSLNRKPVPLSSVGTVQRATNAPITMPIEMMKGENPAVTSLVGASALPSQTAAASPQNTPSLCREIVDRADACRQRDASPLRSSRSPQRHQQRDSQNQHDHRHPKMHVGEDADHQLDRFMLPPPSSFTGRCSSNDLRAAIAMTTGTRLSSPVTGRVCLPAPPA